MNLAEYPIAYTIRYRILSIIQLLRLCLCLVQSLIQRLMEFLLKYPIEKRYNMPFMGLIQNTICNTLEITVQNTPCV